MKPLALSVALTLLPLGAAAAGPSVRVTYVDGIVQVMLEGSFAGSSYTVFRAPALEAEFRAITYANVLCLGECFAADGDAVPGRTYYYRFDLVGSDGAAASFGPYAVSIPDNPVRVRVGPNPSRERARVSLSLPGGSRDGPLQAEVRVLDLKGRTVRVLHRGALARGVTTLEWDGRSDGGGQLGAGLYFVRVTSPLGSSTTRFTRIP
jgi:hypothetical protein